MRTATMGVRLDRESPSPCLGEGQVCTGSARYLLVLGSEIHGKISLVGLCSWCKSTQRAQVMAAAQAAGWNISAGLVDLEDDVSVRKLERELNDMLDQGEFILGEMPSAS